MGVIQDSMVGAIRSVGVAAGAIKANVIANKIASALADDINPDNQQAASQVALKIQANRKTKAQRSEDRVKRKKQKKDLASV